MTETDPKLIEAVARALCRRQIIANLRYDPPRRDDEKQFIQRCEDASWNDANWLSQAETAITAYEAARGDGVCDPAEFEVRQEGMMVAGASGSRAYALNEVRHYAAVYEQDGPVEVVEIVPLDLRTGRAMIAAAKGE